MNPWVRKEARKNKDVLVSRRDVALSRDKLSTSFFSININYLIFISQTTHVPSIKETYTVKRKDKLSHFYLH